MSADPYSVLGLPRGSTADEIKKSFRHLALKFHPDRHTQAPEADRAAAANKFKLITEAYETLTDDVKRAQYERTYSSSYSSSSNTAYSYGNQGTQSWTYEAPRSSGYARLSLWQALKRGVGARKLEVALFTSLTLLAVFGSMGGGVDALWQQRNAGRSFDDMQATIQPKGTAVPGRPGVRSQPYPVGSGITERAAAEMPLAQLIAAEEKAGHRV